MASTSDPVKAAKGSRAELLAHVAWTLGAAVLTKAGGLAVVVIVSRLLGAADYGAWSLVFALTQLAAVLAGLGTFQAVVQFLPSAAGSLGRSRVVWAGLLPVAFWGLALVALNAAFGVRLFVALGFDEPNVLALVPFIGPLGVVIALRTVVLHTLRAENELRLFSVFGSLGTMADLMAAVAGAYWFHSLYAIMWTHLGVSVALLIPLVRHVFPIMRWPAWSKSHVAATLAYSLPLLITQIGDELLARGDRILIGNMLGTIDTAVYVAAYSLASLPNVLTQALISVVFPKLTGRRWTSEQSRRYRHVMEGATIAGGLCFSLLLGLTARPVVALMLGMPAGEVPETISLVAGLCALGVMLAAWGRLISLSIFAAQRTGLAALVWGSGAAVNIALNWVLIPRLGLLGPAIATLVAYSFFVMFALIARRYTGGAA